MTVMGEWLDIDRLSHKICFVYLSQYTSSIAEGGAAFIRATVLSIFDRRISGYHFRRIHGQIVRSRRFSRQFFNRRGRTRNRRQSLYGTGKKQKHARRRPENQEAEVQGGTAARGKIGC